MFSIAATIVLATLVAGSPLASLHLPSKETIQFVHRWTRVGPAPENHTINLQIVSKQSLSDELKRHLYKVGSSSVLGCKMWQAQPLIPAITVTVNISSRWSQRLRETHKRNPPKHSRLACIQWDSRHSGCCSVLCRTGFDLSSGQQTRNAS